VVHDHVVTVDAHFDRGAAGGGAADPEEDIVEYGRINGVAGARDQRDPINPNSAPASPKFSRLSIATPGSES